MNRNDTIRVVAALVIAVGAAYRGYRKSSLDFSGAVAAFFTGLLTFSAGVRFGLILLAFFFSSSKLTHIGSGEPGQRNWIQVLCNSLPATISGGMHFIRYGANMDSFSCTTENADGVWLLGIFLAFYSACAGDTWASEVGGMAKSTPILITTCERVPRGTKGGITLLGYGASLAAGIFIGSVWWASSTSLPVSTWMGGDSFLAVVGFAAFCSVFGTTVDSILGATLQYSGFDVEAKKVVNNPPKDKEERKVTVIRARDILSNDGVNIVSSTTTALVGGQLAVMLFC